MNENERIDDLGINNLKIIQNKEYFCFGIDSVLLANFVNSSSSKNVILDLCTGSGVIPIIISAKKVYKKIFGVELQEKMYDLFTRNVTYNKLEDKISCIKEDIKNVNSIKDKIGQDKVDIIVCNPPYKMVGTGLVNKNDVKYIARHEAKCNLEDVFKSASLLLKSKGKLYIVHKPQRLVDLLSVSRKYNLEAKKIQLVIPKINKKPSIVLIEYVKDGKNEVDILEPLIEYKEDGDYTDEIYRIYGLNDKGVDIKDGK